MSKYLFIVRPSEAKLGPLHKIIVQKDNIFKVGFTVENNLSKDYGINSGGQIYLLSSNKIANHSELITLIKKKLRESEFNQISIKTGTTDLKSGYFIGNASNAVAVVKRYLNEKEPTITFDARYDLQVEGSVNVESKIDYKIDTRPIVVDHKSINVIKPDFKEGTKYEHLDLLNRIIAVETENKALKENAMKFKGVFATILGKIAELEAKVKSMNDIIDEIKEGNTITSDVEETEENDEEVEEGED